MCNFVNNLCASFSLLCQNWHADLEFACKFCFLVCVCWFQVSFSIIALITSNTLGLTSSVYRWLWGVNAISINIITGSGIIVLATVPIR